MATECCGLCSWRIGAGIVIWLSMIGLLYEVYFVLSGETGKYTFQQSIIFVITAILALILNIVGILGNIKENLKCIKFFYIFQWYKVVILTLRVITLRENNINGLGVYENIFALGIEIYFTFVIYSYYKVLKSDTEEASPVNNV